MVNNPLTKIPQPYWRQETAFVYSPQPHYKLTPGWANPAAGFVGGPSSFTLQGVGGAVFLQDCVPGAQPGRGIHWQIENSGTGALHLTEFTVHGGAIGPRLTVEAPSQLFPALAVTGTTDGRLLLAGLFSNGYLLWIRLGVSSSSGAILAGLSTEMLHGLNLTQPLAPITAPTSLAATPEAVVIGGSSGSVLCVPHTNLEDGNISHCFELRDNSWALTKLISGVLYRPRQPGVLACVPVTLAQRQLLLVLYDDCVLRVFNVGRRQHVATLELETQVAAGGQISSAVDTGGRQRSNGSRHLVPTYMAAENSQHTAAAGAAHVAGESHHSGGSELTLVVEFEAPDTLSRHTYVYTLSSSAGGRLALSNSVELKQQETGVVVLEARVSGDTVWLLVRSQGWAKVLGFDRNRGGKMSNALLADSASERVGSLTGGVGNGAEVDQELWECLLEAFPEHLSAEAQVCHAMLVPGQTCRASLRDALSDHGATVSYLEVENGSFAKLQSWMREAVLNLQLRMPSASVPECWMSFLATYRKHWACHHPPLGLILHPGSPEWLGLARGGSMLCMLRPSAFVEMLSSRLRLRGDVDDLHHCAVEAGSLLGPLVQEACLVLLVAGVDPLERLIPRLCETLHRGPSTAGGGGGGSGMAAGVSSSGPGGGPRAAALTDSAREAQQHWRQRRLQVISAIGRRLGSHASLVDSMSAYLDAMNQSTPEPCVNMAPSGGGAALVSGNAATTFLVSTGRQICRAVATAGLHAALLLGLAVQQGALGITPLAREVLVELEGTLLPFVCELLQRAALGLWLTETPSCKGEPAEMEPTLSGLKHLHLGRKARKDPEAEVPSPSASQCEQLSVGSGGAAAKAAVAAVSSVPSGDISLAARLVPAFFASCRKAQLDLLSGPEFAGHLFTLYLQYGGIAGQQLKIPVAARVLQLGCQLSKMCEYGNLAELSQLAGAKGSADAGPQFLRGMGIARALISELRGDTAQGSWETRKGKVPRAKRVAEAVGCFFRAAGGLASDSSDTFRAILSDLDGKLAGINQGLPHAASSAAAATRNTQQTQRRREAALWQLQFCEYVMEDLFAGVPEGAVVFAEAALEHLRTAYGNPEDRINARSPLAVAAAPAGVDPAAMLLQDSTEIVDDPAIREARLWGNIYAYCVEMQQYDRAYAALLANPLPASRLQNLRHLVHVLITGRRLQTLCTLPLAGVVVVPASEVTVAKDCAGSSRSQIEAQQTVEPGFGSGYGYGSASLRTVSLLSQVLDLLHRRTGEISESPQPYQVLYDFLVCRNDFKGAARAMTAYAWRLRSEGSDTQATIAEALRAYELAISCLSQLPADEAWLDLTDPWMKEHVKIRNKHHHMPGHLARSVAAEGGIATVAAAADGQLASAAVATLGGSGAERRDGGLVSMLPAGGDSGMVATLQSLKRERTLLFYSSMVAARVPGLRPLRQWDNEEAILQQLLLLGRYDGAQALVEGCGGGQGGAQWLKYMQLVVENLAEHSTVLQLQDGGLTPNGERPPRRRLEPVVDDFEGLGLGTASAAAVAATLGGRAAPLWGRLRNLLLQMVNRDRDVELNTGGLPVAWLLRDTAARAVLSTDKRIDLPQWLQDMFLAPPGDSVAAAPASMGSWSCGPASLLVLYVQHNRLPAAVDLVCSQVDLWSNEDVLRRRQHCAAWMPYPQVELLRAKLVVSKQLNEQRFGALLEQLDAAMAAHVELVRMDTEGVKAYQIEGVGGTDGGDISEAAGFPTLLMLQAPEAASSPAGGVPSPMFGMGFGGGMRLFG
ncbi:hypothetical protein Vretimale_5570 [Volvox reticuliferus]|uniref:NUP160 middle TPR domain-containing protein n=2 Tax=Volvox reticuliferus TaxID=1737510 RepID=A0A8J4C5K4_9CHLO|nr:hypothetical protein Vretifemale_5590 [Volvox reticuliferus]GIM00576.1 hypothetical protein Vretimale_5570 [Volvox reticuliferus]